MPPNKEQRERLRDWIEVTQDASDADSDVVKGCWHQPKRNPVPPDNDDPFLDIGEAYKRGDVSCHVHIALYCGRCNLHAHYLCARFQNIEGHFASLNIQNGRRSTESLAHVDLSILRHQQYGSYQPVFVAVGKHPQLEQGMKERLGKTIPSIVRLMSLDACPMFRGDLTKLAGPSVGVNYSEVLGRRSFRGTVAHDRELNLLGLAGFSSTALVNGELPNEVIKHSAKIMEYIPDDKSPTVSKACRGERCHPEDVVSALRVKFDAQSWSVSWNSESRADLLLKGVAVLFGPVELGPTSTEVGLIGHD